MPTAGVPMRVARRIEAILLVDFERPDEGGAEERVCRYFAVLQWDAHGFPLDERKPDIGERWDSPWGPSLVLERDDDPEVGTYLLLRVYAHGYEGKPGEIGTARPDVPKELHGAV